jgi:glycosyltransferase involved in cell wall biosynthesis
MKKILIFYNFFKPAQKAGGIVRSLDNMITLLANEFQFSVFTSAFDLGEKAPMKSITHNNWIKASDNTSVYYATTTSILNLFSKVKIAVKHASPDVVYINGIFSPGYTILPLLAVTSLMKNTVVVIAPRGMLQEGALSIKPIKKKLYLAALKMLLRRKKIRWHATDEQEMKDVSLHFGEKSDCVLAYDTPVGEIVRPKKIIKHAGSINLVYLSLITEKKNLAFLIQALRMTEPSIKIVLDVYGPVIDFDYWHRCLTEIGKLPTNVKVLYHGAIGTDKVIETIQKSHFFVLPTLGENFGHAIFESLAAGRPVLISNWTPWQNITGKKAGWIFSLDQKSILSVIQDAAQMGQEQFDEFCTSAQFVAHEYLSAANFRPQYRNLFQA